MKRNFVLCSLCFATLSLFSCGSKKETAQSNYVPEVKIYSIIHEEETQALTELFTKQTGIPAAYLRASTGELVNRVISEKDNPQADILLGGASSYHIQAAKEGALESYVSPLAKNLPSYAFASDNTWTGFCALAKNVGQFPDSGSAPAKLLGTGEYALGVSYLHALAKYNAQGFNVKPIAPPQSVGDVDCVSIMKNTKNLSAAQKFVDFILSVEAQELMGSITFTTPVNPEAAAPQGSIAISDIDLIDYDVQKAASEKSEVLERWNKTVSN